MSKEVFLDNKCLLKGQKVQNPTKQQNTYEDVPKCSNMDMGDTTIKKTEFKNADINASMGDIEVTDSEFKDMKLTADMGEITVKSAVSLEDYKIDADVSMGDVKVNGKKYSDDYSQKGKAGTLTVDSSMGDAEIAW